MRLTLAKRVHKHHRSRWQTLGHPVTGPATSGRNLWRLTGHGRLTPGRYRITLTPTHAASKSLTFLIGYINMLNLFNNLLEVRYHGDYQVLAGA